VSKIAQEANELQRTSSAGIEALDGNVAMPFDVVRSDEDFERAADFGLAIEAETPLPSVSTPLERVRVPVPPAGPVLRLKGTVVVPPRGHKKSSNDKIALGGKVLQAQGNLHGLSARESSKLQHIMSTSTLQSVSNRHPARTWIGNSGFNGASLLPQGGNISAAEGVEVLNYLALLQRIDVMVSRRLLQLRRLERGAGDVATSLRHGRQQLSGTK